MPAVLLEGGFMDSTTDIKKLRNNNVLREAGKQVGLAAAEYAGLASFTKDYLSKGDSGNQVRQLQLDLKTLGYSVGSYGADGVYGDDTVNAVKRLQRDNKLTVDGIAGQATLSKLKQLIEERRKRIMATPSPWAKESWERM